ncbi:MAG: hypothetical protein WB999_16590 [Candidatus Binataceae bacterium]
MVTALVTALVLVNRTLVTRACLIRALPNRTLATVIATLSILSTSSAVSRAVSRLQLRTF